MLRKNIQPGVVYAFKRRSYDEPVPVVVVATDALYADLRDHSKPHSGLAFRVVDDKATHPGWPRGLPVLFLPGRGNPAVWDLSLPQDGLEVFQQWRDVRRPSGGLRAGVVNSRTLVGTWADHVARKAERDQAAAARRAVEDEMFGRQQEVEAETVLALHRLAGVKFGDLFGSRVVARHGRSGYELDQESMDRVIHALTAAGEVVDADALHQGDRASVTLVGTIDGVSYGQPVLSMLGPAGSWRVRVPPTATIRRLGLPAAGSAPGEGATTPSDAGSPS